MKLRTVGYLALAWSCIMSVPEGGDAAENLELYSTSFESFTVGALSTHVDGDVTWTVPGKAAITTKYRHTGTRSLHVHGGTGNTVELSLSGKAQSM